MLLTSLYKRASLENPKYSLSDPRAYDFLGGEETDAGVAVTREKAWGYGPYFRGLNLIAGAVAKLPLITYLRQGEGKARAPRHSAYRLLKYKPCPELTSYTFKKLLQTWAIDEGNGYAYIYRGDFGPRELWPLNPRKTYPIRENRQLWYVTEVKGEPRKLYADDVIHIRGLGWDGLEGQSVRWLARQTLGRGVAIRRFGSIFFKQAARPNVVLIHPGRLSEKARRNIARSWGKMHAGLDNAHRTAVLEEAIQVKELSINAHDAQLTEQEEAEVRATAAFLNIPPHKLGDRTRTSYGSLEQENQSFLDDCLDDWLVQWELECYDKLLTNEEKAADSHTIEFLRSALVRADILKRYQAYAIGINNRFLRPNEARAAENLNPYEGGDEILAPLNLGSLPETDEPAGDDATSAQRQLLEETLRRCVVRLQVQARKAAAKPKRFLAELDAWPARHGRVLAAVLAPVLRVCEALADPETGPCPRESPRRWSTRLIKKAKGELVRLAGEVGEGALAAAVERHVADWARWPAKLANRWPRSWSWNEAADVAPSPPAKEESPEQQ